MFRFAAVALLLFTCTALAKTRTVMVRTNREHTTRVHLNRPKTYVHPTPRAKTVKVRTSRPQKIVVRRIK